MVFALGEPIGNPAIQSSEQALAQLPSPADPTKPEGSAPKTGTGSLGGASVAQQQTQTLQRADARIAEGAAYAGVTLRPTTNHVDRFTNAIAVYNKLVDNASYSNDPEVKGAADKFLLDMGKIGEKFGLNFGLSTAPTEGNPKGTPLNQGKFAGIDYKAATDTLLAHTKTLLEQSKATNKEPLWGDGSSSGAPSATSTSPKPTKEPGSGAGLPKQALPVSDPKTQAQTFMGKVNKGDTAMLTVTELNTAINTKGLLSPIEQKVAKDFVAGMEKGGYPQAPADAVLQRLPEAFAKIQTQSPATPAASSQPPQPVPTGPQKYEGDLVPSNVG
jgi:surface antigen